MDKNSATKVVAAAPVVEKSVSKGKREPETVLEKAIAKKQNKDESVQEAIEKKKKAELVESSSSEEDDSSSDDEPKLAAKQDSSSGDDSSSDDERVAPPANKVALSAVKNAFVSTKKALNPGDLSAALQVLKEEQPRDFVLNYHKISRNLDGVFNPPQPPEPFISPFPMSSFTDVPQDMQEWADGYFGNMGAVRPLRYKSIIIEGDSRTGKTMWARCLGVHNYLSGYLDLNPKCYSNDAEYNIIDNIKPEDLKRKHWKELLGGRTNWHSNCKYSKPVQITGGIPSIVLCNPGEGNSYKHFPGLSKNRELRDWTIRNAVFINLSGPLY